MTVLLPLGLLLILLISADGGAAVYGHTRVGQRGREFKCLKFRTMLPGAERLLDDLLATDVIARAEWNRDFKLKKDPRVTRVGGFLRKSSLDELPQLWNVFKGDMSLVGPRPVVRAELVRYGTDVAYYLTAKPGVTGLWQVSGRNLTDYPTRVGLDCTYVRTWTIWLDVRILLRTLPTLFNRRGAY